jgi:K+-transporting ATPase KdpF subunit
MSAELLLVLIVAGAVAVYLVYTLIRPDRF